MKDFEDTDTAIVNDDIFSYLVKKETSLKNIYPSAIYVRNSISSIH